MSRFSMRLSTVAVGLLALAVSAPAVSFNLNKSIRIGEGVETDGHSTVNGSITVDRSAVVNGSLETVNGAITIGDGVRLGNAETVNGRIRVGANVLAGSIGSVNGAIRIAENVVVDGDVSVVNGRISLGSGSRVQNDVSNVNGDLDLEGTQVSGNVSTVNGDVTVTDNSIVYGDAIVEKPGGWSRGRDRRRPRVIIGPGSRVEGEIILEREVELYLSDTATVGGVSGKMSLDDAVRFSGSRP